MRISCCHHIYNQACEINKYKNSLERKCQRKNIFLAFKDLAKEKNIFRTWLGGVSRNRKNKNHLPAILGLFLSHSTALVINWD